MTTTNPPATAHTGLLAAADLILERGLGRFPRMLATTDPATGEICLLGALQLAFWGDASPDVVDQADDDHWGVYFEAVRALEDLCRDRYALPTPTLVSDTILADTAAAAELLRAAARTMGEAS